MAGKSYTAVQRLAGAVLARLRGEEHAAAELKVDRATVRRWLAKAPEGWQLTRDLAEARLQEQLAAGKLNAATLATVSGIAERNLRYQALIAQREARRQATAEAEPDPMQELIDSLDDRRGRLLAQQIRLVELERQSGEAPEPTEDRAGPDALAEFVTHVRDLSDDEVASWLAETEQAIAEAQARMEAHFAAKAEAARAAREVATTPEAAESSPPSQEPSQPSKRALRVVPDDIEEHWQRYGRWTIE